MMYNGRGFTEVNIAMDDVQWKRVTEVSIAIWMMYMEEGY